MRPARSLLAALVPALALLAGCAPGPWAAVAGVELASVAVFGRGVIDIGVSAATGQDCSIVRLDRGQTYCAPPYVPRPEAYCTRTLANVDCWAVAAPGTTLADTPPPTRAQRAYRDAPWPKALTTRP